MATEYRSSHGYVRILIPGHPLADKRGWVYRHRLVAAEQFGVDAVRGAIVHHDDERRGLNDAPDNLVVCASRAEHNRRHPQKRAANGRFAGRAAK